jgi:hypothetical protein
MASARVSVLKKWAQKRVSDKIRGLNYNVATGKRTDDVISER